MKALFLSIVTFYGGFNCVSMSLCNNNNNSIHSFIHSFTGSLSCQSISHPGPFVRGQTNILDCLRHWFFIIQVKYEILCNENINIHSPDRSVATALGSHNITQESANNNRNIHSEFHQHPWNEISQHNISISLYLAQYESNFKTRSLKWTHPMASLRALANAPNRPKPTFSLWTHPPSTD